jgi:Zn-dependent M28 family amino/carboxypeptidase
MGAEHSTMQKNVERVAQRVGYTLAADPMPEENYFIRSDQYSFVLRGVPAVDVTDGPDSSDPKINGLEFQKKWNVTRYHTPLDNMEQPMDFTSAARASGFNFLLGVDLAQQEQVPAWNKDDFFGTRFGAIHSSSGNAR